MPKKPINYASTIMYKIVCKDLNVSDCYVGHTTNFVKRKCEHKSRSCNAGVAKNNLYVYQKIREHGGWDNFDMIQIEEYDGKNRLDVLKRERHWIETLKPNLNRSVPSRTYKEYNDEHKEEHKQYYINNRERILKRVSANAKEKASQIAEYHKKYYEKNKEKLREKHQCKCGGRYTTGTYLAHIKTNMHKSYFENKLE